MNVKMFGNFRHCILAREIRQRDGFIAPFINMPNPAIAAIEILGVYAIELAHALREVGFGGVQSAGDSGCSSGTKRGISS